MLQLIAFIFPEYYELLEAIKFFGAFLIVGIFVVVALQARASILETLLRGAAKNDSSLCAAIGCGTANDESHPNQLSVLTVKRRFAEYLVVMTISMAATLSYGLVRVGLTNGDRDYQWERKLEDQPGISFPLFRIVAMLTLIVSYRTFQIPPQTSSADQLTKGQAGTSN